MRFTPHLGKATQQAVPTNILLDPKRDFTHDTEYIGKEKLKMCIQLILASFIPSVAKCKCWLWSPNAPRLSGRALHMVNISHWGAGVPPNPLSYGCLAAA